MKKYILNVVVMLLLCACGGGGGGSSNSEKLKDPGLFFSMDGPFERPVDTHFYNGAQSNERSTGKISYSSSNPIIATVDSNGYVTVLSAGSVKITASISADQVYAASSKYYLLDCKPATQVISFSTAGPVAQHIDLTVENRVVDGKGSGKITYSSSNNNVATVNREGVVKIVSAYGDGQAVITATKAADNNYLQATASFTVSAIRLTEIIKFEQPDNISFKMIGSNFANRAAGSGTGVISYSSDNTQVATVDSSGNVSMLGKGRAVITANKAQDDRYFPSSAKYVVSSGIPAVTWLGNQSSIVEFPAVANGFSFFSSSDLGCDFANYLNCLNSQMVVLLGIPVVDKAATLANAGNYLIKKDGLASALNINTGKFSSRVNHSVVSFGGKLWLIGGGSNGAMNDIWASADGKNWSLKVAHAQFPARAGHQVVVYNNKLWLIGGLMQDGFANDVWSSSDGISWHQEVNNAPFSPRALHQVVAYKNKMWVIGGMEQPGKYTNDVWSSADGVTWALEALNAEFSPRFNHQVIVVDEKLVLVGGDGSPIKGDIWSSVDGKSWIKELEHAAFWTREGHKIAKLNGKFWLIGGEVNSSTENTAWASSDGITWTKEVTNLHTNDREGHALVSFDNQLWMVGGNTSSGGGIKNDVWSSKDGNNWIESGIENIFSARHSHHLVNFDDKLWVIGGVANDYDYKNDVWSSVNGVDWIKQVEDAAFEDRTDAAVAVYKNKIWLMGGYGRIGGLGVKKDIWTSVDGANWIKQSDNADFAGRYGYKLVVFKDKLWVMGGARGESNKDVWYTDDGIIWTKISGSFPFSYRLNHNLVVFNNKLWLIGGNDQYSTRTDIWSSLDGINWVEEINNLASGISTVSQVSVFNNKLWVSGGSNLIGENGVTMVSADGNHWDIATSNTGITQRDGQKLVAYKNKLFLIGGIEDNSIDKNDVWSSTDGIEWRKGAGGVFEF